MTSTLANFRVDHEYRRNVILTGTAGITRNEYRTGGEQTLYAAGLSATYLLNRYAGLTTAYDFVARQSSGNLGLNLNGLAPGANFVDHRIVLQLRFSL